MLVRIICLMLVAFVTPISLADDGWWSISGGIGKFGKGHPSIRMTSEDLRISITNDESADVDVQFRFRNDGPATTVTMAFPEKYEQRVDSAIDDFQTWVDGHRVKARRKMIKDGQEDEGDSLCEAVWLKRVKFEARQTRTVRVTYLANISGDTSGSRSLAYTLTTGASWKGPIGKCKVAVSWSRLKGFSTPYLDLSGARWSYGPGKRAQAILKNWEPNSDLSISMERGFWNFWINGKPVDPTKGHGWIGSPYTVGSGQEVMLHSLCFDEFFGGWVSTKALNREMSTKWVPWTNPVVKKFGGPFTIDGSLLKFPLGRSVLLKGGFISSGIEFDSLNDFREKEYVYVKDVVEALGGKFRYIPEYDRVEIWF